MSKTSTQMEFLIKQNLNNLADIPDNKDLIVKYLIHRYEQGKIYTWVGPVLLAMNPRVATSNLDFFNETRQDYHPTKFKSNAEPKRQAITEPHVFAVAASAHYRLSHTLGKVHQTIVISGDSGSGKTFSASKILRFLSATNENPFNDKDSSPSSTLSKIEKACSVLSPFSTASTERNKFSSRHGQLVQLQYLNSSMQGAVLNSFLLERSRVTGGCNNFHIFSQMLDGLSNQELETLKLSRSTYYKIVNSRYDVTGLEHTLEAMNSLGLVEEEIKGIFTVIAVLIHLGNIEFKELVTGGCDIDLEKKGSSDALEGAFSLMELSASDLVKLLTTSLIKPCKSRRHSEYYTAIPTIEACNTRLHSIVRYLYHRLFEWLVNRLNEILVCRKENLKLLGVLDIFGFEFFSDNSIEQLSINYANERMQNHFIQKYVEASRSELESEGLRTLPPPPTSHFYKQRLAAIEGSLFPTLNDACLIARIEKCTSLNQLGLAAEKENERFVYNRGENFSIRHYSCIVEYKTADILLKNNDKVPVELPSTLILCRNKFILSLLDNDDEWNKAQQQDPPSRVDKKKNTTLAKLKYSMDGLIKELDKYDLHYIRCVKPITDLGMIKDFKEQLACSGILDALSLARCTLPIRLRYDEFKKRYSKGVEINKYDIKDSMSLCKAILNRVLTQEELLSLVHFGSRLIFLAENVLYKLEAMREEFRSQCALRIQSFWNKYKLRKHSKANVSLIENVINIEDSKTEELTKEDNVMNSNRLCDFIVNLNKEVFFYQNRILSRQRLADIPVRFHTRLTCLLESHRTPRSELSSGLKDCL